MKYITSKHARVGFTPHQIGAGFTLVELLIASSIFSVIILSLYSAFQTGVLTYNRMDSAFMVYQASRVTLNRLELDLKNSFIYSENDAKFRGSSQTLDFFSVIDAFEEGASYASVYRIQYELSGTALKRTCYQGVDALKENGAAFAGDELTSEAKEISFQYAFATGNPDKPYDWQDSWPQADNPEQQKALPLAVKIKLSLIEKGRQEKELSIVEFTKIVSLPLSEGLQTASSGAGAAGE
jgi:prepilin-type N-terminal cleavage/methylation domain-containing protein